MAARSKQKGGGCYVPHREVLYESDWVCLYGDRVQYPDGHVLERHHVVHMTFESAVVAVTNGRGEVLLIHSNRYVTGTREWEIPAGRIEPGETALQAAARETREETGCDVTDVRELGFFHPSNGISDSKMHLCVARVAAESDDYDRNEVAGKRWASPEEVRRMILSGQMHCGVSMLGLLWALLESEQSTTE